MLLYALLATLSHAGTPRCHVGHARRAVQPDCSHNALLLRGGDSGDDWKAALQLAMQAQQDGNLEAAAAAYREAMALHESLRGAWPVLTNYGLSIQPTAPAEAAAAFRTVVALVPDGADGYFNLGNALMDSGDLEGCVGAFESCLALAPKDADAYYNLGAALLQMREPKRALPAMTSAAAIA